MNNENHIFFRISNYDNESIWILDCYDKEVLKLCKRKKYNLLSENKDNLFKLTNEQFLDFIKEVFVKQDKWKDNLEKKWLDTYMQLQIE
jgi:hypothetical protein